MRPALGLTTGIAIAALSACGGGGERATGDRAEATAPSSSTATPAEAPVAARSERECAELWNETAHPGTAGQKSPTDFLIEVATRGDPHVLVLFDGGECLIFARLPEGSREAYIFVAPDGRAPFGQPDRMDIAKGQELRTNARATADGRIELQ